MAGTAPRLQGPSIPTTALDRLHAAADSLGDQQLRAVLRFAGRLDVQRLRRALTLSLSAFPVLACRWEEEGGAPLWRAVPAGELPELLEVQAAGDPFGSHRGAALRPLELGAGLPWRAQLLRGSGDTLCFRWHHAVGDAAGIVGHMYTVAELYRRLGGDPRLDPPALAPGSRSLGPVLRAVGPLAGLRVAAGDLFGGAPRGPHVSLDLVRSRPFKPFAVLRRVPPSAGAGLQAARLASGATINDVLLAALLRALERTHASPGGLPRRLLVTVNLRRYLSRALRGRVAQPANRSHVMTCELSPPAGTNDLPAVLEQVQLVMARAKRGLPGLHGLLPLLALLRAVPWQRARRALRGAVDPERGAQAPPPCLTNGGELDAERLDFGGLQPQDAMMASVVSIPPALQIGVTSYRGALTLSALSCLAGPNRERLGALLDAMVDELGTL